MEDYFRETLLGERSVDLKGYLEALEEIGDKGFFTTEREVGLNVEKDM